MCHGPDDGQRKADLRLDTRDGALGNRDGGTPFVPGKPDESEAWVRITATDASGRTRTYDSVEEMPADVRAIHERVIKELNIRA